jgi:hypothetical protein
MSWGLGKNGNVPLFEEKKIWEPYPMIVNQFV